LSLRRSAPSRSVPCVLSRALWPKQRAASLLHGLGPPLCTARGAPALSARAQAPATQRPGLTSGHRTLTCTASIAYLRTSSLTLCPPHAQARPLNFARKSCCVQLNPPHPPRPPQTASWFEKNTTRCAPSRGATDGRLAPSACRAACLLPAKGRQAPSSKRWGRGAPPDLAGRVLRTVFLCCTTARNAAASITNPTPAPLHGISTPNATPLISSASAPLCWALKCQGLKPPLAHVRCVLCAVRTDGPTQVSALRRRANPLARLTISFCQPPKRCRNSFFGGASGGANIGWEVPPEDARSSRARPRRGRCNSSSIASMSGQLQTWAFRVEAYKTILR
jgi:hypothetical protein